MMRYYDHGRKRLVYIGREASPDMWDERWEKEDLMKLFSRSRDSLESGLVRDVTGKYLRKGAKILEGGCGLGDKVFVLKQSGYEVIGVDYAAQTVARLNEVMPELDVRYGDIRQLSFPDDAFDGYWSFGVIEHDYDGFQEIAREMHRVLRPGGILFMTVPALSQLRRIKAAAGVYPAFNEDSTDMSRFYQFAYSFEEIRDSFKGHGFDLMEKQGWSVYKGVRDEIPGTHILMSFLFRYLGKQTWSLLKNYCNHSFLYVFQRT